MSFDEDVYCGCIINGDLHGGMDYVSLLRQGRHGRLDRLPLSRYSGQPGNSLRRTGRRTRLKEAQNGR